MTGYIAKSQIVHTENDEYYVNCNAGSSETKRFTYTDPAEALELRHSLLELAKMQLGSRYVYGAARPGAFDCSGLTYYLYKKHNISLLRRASQQLQNGIVVPKEAMQVGDLVFFRETGNYPADHVGIYAGNNKIIHASTKRGIEYADMDEGYCKDYFLCARRIVVTGAATPAPVAMTRSISSTLIANSVSGRTA
jgi:cell wall-associated NlpC family hydrolase